VGAGATRETTTRLPAFTGLNVTISAVVLAAVFLAACERNKQDDPLPTDPYGLFPPADDHHNQDQQDRRGGRSASFMASPSRSGASAKSEAS